MIQNNAKISRTLVDFVRDVGRERLISYIDKYGDINHGASTYDEKSLGDAYKIMVIDAENRFQKNKRIYTILPGMSCAWIFGDEQGDMLGKIFDYELRDGGKRNNWKWKEWESLR
jgi:hypothetical protein